MATRTAGLSTSIPTADISLSSVEAATTYSINAANKERKRTTFRRVLRAVGSIATDVLTAIFICLVYGIPGLLLCVAVIALFALSLASIAANGAVTLLVGNAILRAAHHAHYTTNLVAAEIGAVGGIIASIIFGAIDQCLPKDENGNVWWPLSLVSSVVASTLAGTIGSAILQKNHVDLHGTDVLHATRAGALGGVILGPALVVAVPLIFAVLMIMFSPLLIAMKLGFRWVYVRSSESWSERGVHRSSYCYTYGTCGDDSDIEEELAQIPQHEKSFY